MELNPGLDERQGTNPPSHGTDLFGIVIAMNSDYVYTRGLQIISKSLSKY